MAFTKELAIIAQNAATAAATLLQGQKATLDQFEAVREAIFEGSVRLAGAESVDDVVNTAPKGRGGYRRGGASSGGSNSGSDNDPGATVINGGKHAGKTIAAVYEAAPDYLEWAVDNLRNEFLRNRIELFLKTV